MPTVEQLASRDWLARMPQLLAACRLLVEHGVNPDRIPDPKERPDAFTPDGVLTITGVDREAGLMVYERRPWPEGLTYRDFLACFELPSGQKDRSP